MYDWAELRHFRYLLAILERQGFRVAVEQLHTSQPNLTVEARQFQENASVRLFEKMKNGRIHPTETGISFISLARLLLETRDEVIDALSAIERGEIGTVRFGWRYRQEVEVVGLVNHILTRLGFPEYLGFDRVSSDKRSVRHENNCCRTSIEQR